MIGVGASGVLVVIYPDPAITGSGGGVSGGSGTVGTTNPSPSGGGAGSISIDRGHWLSATARDRRTGATVYVDGVPLTSVYGEVQIEQTLEDPVKKASFYVADRRVARYVEGSLADGDKSCQIDFTVGPGSDLRTWTPFIGRTLAAPNEGPYRPRANFKVIANSGEWAARPGCIRLSGFQGHTRGWILRAYALSAGVTMPASVEALGAIVTRPIDLSGIGIVELILRYGEIEGWWPRIDDETNSIDVISDRYVMTGEPLVTFDESNIIAITDEPPSHPPTEFVLSGSKMTDATLGEPEQKTDTQVIAGADPTTGEPFATITTITSERGVEILKVIEEYATFQREGVVTGPLNYELRRRTEVRSEWERAAPVGTEPVGRLTTQLKKRVQTIYDMSAVPMAVGAPGSHVWSNGVVCDRIQAELIKVQETTWDVIWNTDLAGVANCTMKSQSRTVKEYYAPLLAGGNTYADQKKRDGTTYTWRTVELETESWADYRFLGAIAPEVDCSRKWQRYVVTAIDAVTKEETETFKDAQSEFERWVGNSSNTRYHHTLNVYSNSIPSPTMAQGDQTLAAGRLLGTTIDEDVQGAVPGPPTGSPTVPQFQQEPFQESLSVTIPYRPNKVTELIEAAESVDELHRVAMRRLYLALCSTVTLTHRHLPFLQPGDPVRVTNRVRGINARRGFIWGISPQSVDLAMGAGRQTTIVKLAPDWPRLPGFPEAA